MNIEKKKNVISLKVRNSFGTLTHITALFSRRGYNIESLSVGETEDKNFSVITLVVKEDEKKMKHVIHQLSKLMSVVEITNLTGIKNYKRELVLIKLSTKKENRGEIIDIVNAFSAKIVDMTPKEMIVELTSYPHKIDAIIQLLSEYNIVKTSRTGTIAISYSS